MLNLNDLYYFVQAVDHQGFAPASRRLGIPKSTLSKRVAALEKQLGVRLIQRTSRVFVVTGIGQDFYRHAAAMLVEAEAAEDVVRGRLAEPAGLVRLTASVPTAQILLADLLPTLACAYPKVHIMLDATDRFVDIVQEGFDIALRDHFGTLPDSGLVQRRIGYEPGLLVASSIYLRRYGTPSTPAELAAHDGLLTASIPTTWVLRGPGDEMVAAEPVARFTANEGRVLLEAAVRGLGVTSLPRSLCLPALRRGALIRVLPDWTTSGVTTTLLIPHRRGQLPSIRAVADFLIERLPPFFLQDTHDILSGDLPGGTHCDVLDTQ